MMTHTCDDVTAPRKRRFAIYIIQYIHRGFAPVNKRRRLHHTAFRNVPGPMIENHVAYVHVGRRRSLVIRRAPVAREELRSGLGGGGRRAAKRAAGRREGREESVSKQCGHLAELSRKPTAEQ